MGQTVAVLNFSAKKLTVLIGQRGVNNTLKVLGLGECAYGGYFRGSFINPDKLGFAISHAVNTAQASCGYTIDKLFIGVPAEFSANIAKEGGVSFNKKRIVTENDIEALNEQANDFGGEFAHVITDINPIYYVLDDDRRVLDPIGCVTSRFSGMLSYIVAHEQFYAPLLPIFADLGIETHYMSSVLSKMLYLFEQKQRDPAAVLIDIGDTSTTVSIGKGQGLLSFSTFPMGANIIDNAFMENFEIPPQLSAALRKHTMLTINHDVEDTYNVPFNNDIAAFSALEVNEIVGDCIAFLAKNIIKCLNRCEFEYPNYIHYNITEGAFTKIRGAKDRLSRIVRRPIELVTPTQPQIELEMIEPLSVLNSALKLSGEKKQTIIDKLFGLFNRQ